MKNCYKTFIAALNMVLGIYGCSTSDWKPTEMSSRRASYLEADLNPSSPSCNFRTQCKFDLYYFQGPPTKSNERNGNILYIPGGPGDIVDRKHAELDGADVNANYIYFDVRGTGYSLIPESNAYDQFLRAKYVVEDIEALRKKVFNECSKGEAPSETGCEQKRKPWKAIYAHSWGTIVAQMYAWTYPNNVDALVLSAPVSRASGNTEAARRTMIVDNLLKIYETYSTAECSWPRAEDLPKAGIGGNNRHPLTDNFCFLLAEGRLKLIEEKLKSLLNELEREYGSTAFVNRFHNELVKEQEFRKKYPYPMEFFKAVRWIEWTGAAENEGFRFSNKVKQDKIDAAFFIAYYITLDSVPPPINDHGQKILFECNFAAPFFQFISDRQDLRTLFCRRMKAAASMLETDERNDNSARASSVFGVFDGLARWIFTLMSKENRTDEKNCFRIQDLDDIVRGKLLTDKKTIQYVVKKIGLANIDKDEKVCPWDPSSYRHRVPTLILNGDADPVTAGGQAQYFYENGLSPGRRAAIGFPGVGHGMSGQLKVQKEPKESEEEFLTRSDKHFASIWQIFLRESSHVDAYIKSRDLKKFVDEFGAHLWP